MKKGLSKVFSILMTLILVLIMGMNMSSVSEAAETTFSGTVSDKTTSQILYLTTSGGTMELKIDSDTTISGTKLVLPGNTVSCSCYRGNDEYWHVSSINGSTQVGKATIDNSTKVTVTGRIAKGTTEELLYLVVDNGTMQIKMDDDTDLDDVTMLIIGKKVNVVTARGSDAYMHALAISDYGNTSSSSSNTTSTTSTTSTSTSTSTDASTTTVSGTVEKGTTASNLYLETSQGTMEFVLDVDTDTTACRVLLPEQKIKVTFYRGNDAWNHTSKLVNSSGSASSTATLEASTQVTVKGTVDDETSEGILYLDTDDGIMQIKLDSNTNFEKCPVLLLNKSVTVVAQRGNDEYYHAVSITAKY